MSNKAPDPYLLSSLAIEGFEMHKMIENLPEAEWQDLQIKCMEEGKDAAEALSSFCDSIICADLSVRVVEYVWQAPNEPMPMALKPNDPIVSADFVRDADNLKMRCCCHNCRDACQRTGADGQKFCKYKFPKPLAEKTAINIKVKTNKKDDSYGNIFSSLTLFCII